MQKIIICIIVICSAVSGQSLGDLRTDKTDTLYIRAEVDIQSETFTGLKPQDILDAVTESVKPLDMVIIPLSLSDTSPEEFLSFRIYIVNNYYTAIGEYNRKVLYRARTEFYEMPAPTWRRMIGGGSGGDKKYVLDVAKEIAGSFSRQFKEQNNIK
jgi:predicted ATP-grasp superfamily ATP-dependent carboligase